MKAELIYDNDCPNAALARERLSKALEQTAMTVALTEWDRADPNAPSYVSRYASPTILIDGADVAGDQSALDGQGGCRIYGAADGSISGAPSVETIRAALAAKQAPNRKVAPKAKANLFASLGAIAFAALPVGACPACLPAYAGTLSAVGLGFAFNGAWSLAILLPLIAFSLATLARKAPQRNGYKPFALGVAAGFLLIPGKLNPGSDLLFYAGSGLLLIACLWNVWPRKRSPEKQRCCQP